MYNSIQPQPENSSVTEIPLLQRHDRKHLNPDNVFKKAFDLFPNQPVYLDVVQKEEDSDRIDVRHTMEDDIATHIEAGRYIFTLATRGPIFSERQFQVSIDNDGKLGFGLINSLDLPEQGLETGHSIQVTADEPSNQPDPGVTFTDPLTSLMWTQADNGKDIDWQCANDYAENLELAGYSDWRLPTIEELEALYDPESQETLKIRKPFRLTDKWVWSSAQEGPKPVEYFDFSFGKSVPAPLGPGSYRALCVRRSGE